VENPVGINSRQDFFMTFLLFIFSRIYTLDTPLKNNIRNTRTVSLNEALDGFLESYNLRAKFNETGLITSWEKIMGKTIASRTEKIYIKDKTLFLKISSSPLRQELLLAKSHLIKLINKEMNQELIDDVILN
jgi:hypothetical protein